jgi:hypothetical protein
MNTQEVSLVGALVITLGIILVLIAWSRGATGLVNKLLF